MNSIAIDALLHASGLPRLDAQMLLLHALGRTPHDRAWLLAHSGDTVSPAVADHFAALAARRAAGEPVAYLLGEKEFAGLAFAVDARVLVPRPDTETLLDWALALIAGRAAPRVLDLGAGSGALAVALAHRRPDAEVHAVDASAAALNVARSNATRHGARVRFHPGDWFAALPAGTARFDCIVSNPPYIAEGDAHLPALAHEPRAALVAADAGLADLRAIAHGAPAWLQPGGWLLLEHGHDQAAAVAALLHAAGFDAAEHRHDLAGIARCTGAAWNRAG